MKSKRPSASGSRSRSVDSGSEDDSDREMQHHNRHADGQLATRRARNIDARRVRERHLHSIQALSDQVDRLAVENALLLRQQAHSPAGAAASGGQAAQLALLQGLSTNALLEEVTRRQARTYALLRQRLEQQQQQQQQASAAAAASGYGASPRFAGVGSNGAAGGPVPGWPQMQTMQAQAQPRSGGGGMPAPPQVQFDAGIAAQQQYLQHLQQDVQGFSAVAPQQQAQQQQQNEQPTAEPSLSLPHLELLEVMLEQQQQCGGGAAPVPPPAHQGGAAAGDGHPRPGPFNAGTVLMTVHHLDAIGDVHILSSGFNAMISEDYLRGVPTPEEATASRSTAWL